MQEPHRVFFHLGTDTTVGSTLFLPTFNEKSASLMIPSIMTRTWSSIGGGQLTFFQQLVNLGSFSTQISFNLRNVDFAGFHIAENKIDPLPKFYNAIRDFSTSTSTTDIRSWFSLVNHGAVSSIPITSSLVFVEPRVRPCFPNVKRCNYTRYQRRC